MNPSLSSDSSKAQLNVADKPKGYPSPECQALLREAVAAPLGLQKAEKEGRGSIAHCYHRKGIGQNIDFDSIPYRVHY